jgi:predicted metal-dependent RNase
MLPFNNKSTNSDDFYYDIYLYLLSVKIGGIYRHYPDYIRDELDNQIIDNKKRLFRYSCNIMKLIRINDYALNIIL